MLEQHLDLAWLHRKHPLQALDANVEKGLADALTKLGARLFFSLSRPKSECLFFCNDGSLDNIAQCLFRIQTMVG